MKKLYFVLAILIVASMILTACSPQPGDPNWSPETVTFYERGTCRAFQVEDNFLARIGATLGGASMGDCNPSP